MKIRNSWLGILLAVIIFAAYPFHIFAAESEDEDKTLAPYFVVESEDQNIDGFPLKDTKVSVDINGVIAEIFVTQTYVNEGKSPINAKYVFPASSRVSVHGMKMQIGNQVVTAKIKEREEAKEEFEEAKQEGKSASLLEQQRPNVFSMDIANIMPGDEVKIDLHYTEMVVSNEGICQFVFPTVVGPRFATPAEEGGSSKEDEWVASPYLREGDSPSDAYDIEVNLSMGVPIRNLESRSHDIVCETSDGDTSAKVTLADNKRYAGDRDFILDYKLTGEQVESGLVLNSDGEENYFMLMVQPPERVRPEEIPPREYIFVLDVSGSMFGYPLDTAKEMIRNLVSGLKETDQFNLILFENDTFKLSPKSLPATRENVRRAMDLIDKQEGGGGTMLAPAMKEALSIPSDKDTARSIVVITDGYLSGEKEIFDIVNKNIGGTSFFAFGIGDSVNRYLIDGIAKTGMGESFVVTEESEAEEAAGRFRTYIESPILTDVHVEYDGFETYDTEPSSVPVLFAQRPIVVLGKYRGEKAGTIRITGKAGGQDYAAEIPVSEARVLEDSKAVAYLWARKRVEKLTDYGLNEESGPEVKNEVTQIGLKYSMMTPYTSFIAVIDTIRNEEGEAEDVKQPLPLPSGVSELAVGGPGVSVGYMSGAEPGEAAMFAILAAVMCLPAISRFRKRRRQ